MSTTLQRITTLLSKPDPIKWLFAGDSITHGALHTFGWRDYTELFSERIRYEMGRARDCVIKTAASGWTIPMLAEHLEWCVIQYCPQVVSINMGMNDCSAGQANLEHFKAVYSKVIDNIRKANDAAIILHTPQRVTPEDASRFAHLPSYVEAIRALAARHDTMLIDHFDDWGRAPVNVNYWLSDPIHPNEFGHRVMANLFMRQVGVFDPNSHVCRLFYPH